MAPSILTRDHALRLGHTRYFTARPCRHGHIEKRYVVNGRCVECQRIASNPTSQRRTNARKVALARGLVRYFTGRPCKFGHLVERYTDGGTCVECARIKQRRIGDRWVRKNPDRAFRSRAEYRAKNELRLSQNRRAAYLKNGEKRRAYSREWHRNNPDKGRNSRRHRRARVSAAVGKHTAKDIANLLVLQRGRCADCLCDLKDGYHVDHIKPIVKGGSNDRYNLQLLCPTCNTRKRAHDPIEWAQRNGRLL